jgi:hypothetical protein
MRRRIVAGALTPASKCRKILVLTDPDGVTRVLNGTFFHFGFFGVEAHFTAGSLAARIVNNGRLTPAHSRNYGSCRVKTEEFVR